MRRSILVFVLAIASSLAYGEQAELRREGEFWIETTSGSDSAGGAEALKIVSMGNVSVHGGTQQQITYSIRRKIRARSEARAREMLREAGVSFTRQGMFTRLVVDDSAGPVDLQVGVPRSMRAVLVGLTSGNIEALDLDGKLSAQTDGGNIRANHIKGAVDLNTAGGTLWLGEVGGSAKALTAGGDITAETIGGEARLETAGGNITVQKVGGTIRANTDGGKVRIGQAGGSVTASTAGGVIDIGHAGGVVNLQNAGGGPILVASADGSVRCESAGGAIKVGSLVGALHLATASGSVVAQLTGSKLLSESYVSTGSGDITLYLPSNLGVSIRAVIDGATRAQSIVSEFPGLQIRFDGGTATAKGEINGGGPVLHVEGNSGMIWIKRK